MAETSWPSLPGGTETGGCIPVPSTGQVWGTSGLQGTLEEPGTVLRSLRQCKLMDFPALCSYQGLPVERHLSYHITPVAGPAQKRAKSPATLP